MMIDIYLWWLSLLFSSPFLITIRTSFKSKSVLCAMSICISLTSVNETYDWSSEKNCFFKSFMEYRLFDSRLQFYTYDEISQFSTCQSNTSFFNTFRSDISTWRRILDCLRIFLQIDINLFYMKTCLYRGVVSISNEISLVCMNESQLRYGMFRCSQIACCFMLSVLQVNLSSW